MNYKSNRVCSYWLFTSLVANFIRALHKKGVPASVVDQRIDRNLVFGGITRGLFNQEEFDENQVSIPIHNALIDDDVTLILNTIKEGW